MTEGFSASTFLEILGATALAVVLVMAITFAVALRWRRHSVIDVTWGLGFVIVAAVSAVVSAGLDNLPRRLLVLALVAAWGLRLATHIALRARGRGEDPRYEEILGRAPGGRNVYALKVIYLPQAAVLWFVSLPVQVAMAQQGSLGAVGWLGVALWLVGIVFETIGDAQLTRFTADPSHAGVVLDVGLWRYTRHPNYFGDACVWWGLSLIAFAHWPGVLTVLSPVVMTYLLAKGTGKPLLEARMANTRRGYAEYVARTSGFIPMPPRRTAGEPR